MGEISRANLELLWWRREEGVVRFEIERWRSVLVGEVRENGDGI